MVILSDKSSRVSWEFCVCILLISENFTKFFCSTQFLHRALLSHWRSLHYHLNTFPSLAPLLIKFLDFTQFFPLEFYLTRVAINLRILVEVSTDFTSLIKTKFSTKTKILMTGRKLWLQVAMHIINLRFFLTPTYMDYRPLRVQVLVTYPS